MDSDGDAVVLVDSDLWLLNPAALEDMSAGGEATSRRGDTFPTSPGNWVTTELFWFRLYIKRISSPYS